jgi:hypothetical protein
MQTLARAILALYLAHLLADFSLQSTSIVKDKKAGKTAAYLKHGFIHCLASVVITGLFIVGSSRSLRLYVVILGLAVTHLVIDGVKVALTKAQLIADDAMAFVLDQILHLLTVSVAAWIFVGSPPISDLFAEFGKFRTFGNRVLFLVVVYVGVIFAGGYLIRFLTKPLMLDKPESSEETNSLRNAGLYIGWLERFLVLTAILLQSPEAAGLILAAKSIARYPELKSVKFAEYFLIGTLLSISLAVVGGIALLKVFHVTIVLRK